MNDIVVYGTATNPTAGGTVATTGKITGGHYKVTVATELTGTLGTADVNNMQVQAGTAAVGQLLTQGTATPYANTPFEVDLPYGGGTISVNAVANASGTAAVYGAHLVLSPIALYP